MGPGQPSPFLGRQPRGPSTAGSNRLWANRRRSRLGLHVRVRLHERRDEIHAELAALDHDLRAMTADRRSMLDELDELRERLWPVEPRKKGRRPPAFDQAALAPITTDAEPLWGSTLRWFLLHLLERHGPTSLRDLHDLVHRYGYCIDSATPVKALADALGYETDEGRARRVRRGVYEVVGDAPTPPVAAAEVDLALMPRPARPAAGEGDAEGDGEVDHVGPGVATSSRDSNRAADDRAADEAWAESILETFRQAHAARGAAADPRQEGSAPPSEQPP